MHSPSTLFVTGLVLTAIASAQQDSPPAPDDHPYIAPGPTDSRGPCPGLNTLANHGYLNRDGRNITRQNMIDAFLDGFGMDSSITNPAAHNALSVCDYVLDSTTCNTTDTLLNLTLLAEPHLFEHDNSLSRQDYKMAYANNASDNNQNFNQTIYQGVLDVIGTEDHVNFQLMNEIRLQRASDSFQNDFPGWYQLSTAVHTVEIGFIYSVISDFTLSDYVDNPQIRTDWWKYWFINESFPYPLGWQKPSPPKNIQYVLSASASVLAASITSTPNALPPGATGPFTQTGLNLTADPNLNTVPILALPTDPPYVSPDLGGEPEVGDIQQALAAVPVPSAIQPQTLAQITSAEATATPVPDYNPYTDTLDVQQFRAIAAAKSSHISEVQAALATPTSA